MSIFKHSFVVLALLVAVVLPPVAIAQGFLAGSADVVSRDRIAYQLRSLLGHGQNSERLAVIEEMLRPTFMALPKDSSGSLEHRSARYALYRYFLVQHGLYIKGLSLDVGENASSLAEMLKSQLPSLVMELLEEQLGSDRVGLDELTVLAFVIEDMVHRDAIDLLELAYMTHGLSTDTLLDADQEDLMIRTFTMYFVEAESRSYAQNQSFIIDFVAKDEDATRTWINTLTWVEDIKQDLAYQARSSSRPFASVAGQHFDFTYMANWAMAISLGYGKQSDLECKDMKNSLLDLEVTERDDGRVGLARFYAPYLAGVSTRFSESSAYLKHLGTLDARQQSVIVPNLIYSKGNCVKTSDFYVVCCIDDCEVLMAGLEEQLSQPVASPALIAAVVSGMPSETVAAPRNLSALMRSKLDEIAGRHGGSVPLHSRLFAQWMHYAFPNECPFPRSLLTSEAQLTDSEWTSKHGVDSSATEKEIHAAADLPDGDEVAKASEGPALVWSDDEELLSDLVVVAGRSTSSFALLWFAGVAFFLASASMVHEDCRAGWGEVLEKGGKQVSQLLLGRVSGVTMAREQKVYVL